MALYEKYAETIRQHKRIKAEVHTQWTTGDFTKKIRTTCYTKQLI